MWSSQSFWNKYYNLQFDSPYDMPLNRKSTLRLDDNCDNSQCYQAQLQFWWQPDRWQPLAVVAANNCNGGGKMQGPLSLEVQGVKERAVLL